MHELDHLNGLVMWDDTIPDEAFESMKQYSDLAVVTPRRIKDRFGLDKLKTEE